MRITLTNFQIDGLHHGLPYTKKIYKQDASATNAESSFELADKEKGLNLIHAVTCNRKYQEHVKRREREQEYCVDTIDDESECYRPVGLGLSQQFW